MNGDTRNAGIISHSIYECFELIDLMPEREFVIKISYLEVYNEQVRDLLNSEPTVVKIQSDGNKVQDAMLRELVIQHLRATTESVAQMSQAIMRLTQIIFKANGLTGTRCTMPCYAN